MINHKFSGCLIFFLFSRILFSGPLSKDVQLISSDFSGCIFQISPQDFTVDTLNVNNRKYHQLSSDHTRLVGEISDPGIPSYTLVVGVPLTGEVQLNFTQNESGLLQNIRLLPVAQVEDKKGQTVYHYEESDVYSQNTWYPENIVRISKPAMMGKQRVVHLTVFPVQYHPVQNKARLIRSLRVMVSFTQGKSSVTKTPKLKNEDLYKLVLANYPVARRWRIAEQRGIPKTNLSQMTGNWYRIPVTQEGIYRITGQQLKDAGINLDEIDPATVKIYNNGGRPLSRAIRDVSQDTFKQIPVYSRGLSDDRFDVLDDLLFYGQGVTGWSYDAADSLYEHYFNIYTTENIYWLVFNDQIAGKHMATVPFHSVSGVDVINTFRDKQFVENDRLHPYEKGGNLWVDKAISPRSPSTGYTLNVNDPVENTSARFKILLFSQTSSLTQCNLTLNNQSVSFPLNRYNPKTGSTDAVQGLRPGANTFALTFSIGSGTAYTDWIELEYTRHLKLHQGRLVFYSPTQPATYAFQIADATQQVVILDVTDIFNAKHIESGLIMDSRGFVDAVETIPKKYVAAESSGFLTPASITEYPMEDLRNTALGADFIIVTHPDFMDAANRLKDHRETHDSLSTLVVNVQDIYARFSWGLFDPVAIRDYISYAYHNYTVSPAYVLLFGDGDYDYRNILSSSEKNWIPPIESTSGSRYSTSTHATEDFFGYVSGTDNIMDVAIGRLPVTSAFEAESVVDKIVRYDTEPDFGPWRVLATLVGDDEMKPDGEEGIGTMHITSCERVARTLPGLFNFQKIYLTEYPREIVGASKEKPATRADIIAQINTGTILVNYFGHSGETIWADENVFNLATDLAKLKNEDRLPLFYSSSCSFGRFDNPDYQSFSEALMTTGGRGAIAVISSARECTPGANENLNLAFMDQLVDSNLVFSRTGTAFMAAKVQVHGSNLQNNETYLLFGDPTQRLGFPDKRGQFSDIQPVPLQALSVVRITGSINQAIPYDGTIHLQVYDARHDIDYRTIENNKLISYWLPGRRLFRGDAEVKNSQFEASFIVPKDVSYNTQSARINGYFWNDEHEGVIVTDSLEISGSTSVKDSEGPDMEIYFSGYENFITGDMVSGTPDLIAEIKDDLSGVNITGELGHKIILTVDESERINLTDRFNYNPGSYQSGKLQYTLTGLQPGRHRLHLKSWDNANNSSAKSVEVNLVADDQLQLERVLNYPNPMQHSTQFTFYINQNADITIKIFTVSGRLIQKIENQPASPGFNMIPWDGRDYAGDALANGVYLYRVDAKAHTADNTIKTHVIEKLMVVNE